MIAAAYAASSAIKAIDDATAVLASPRLHTVWPLDAGASNSHVASGGSLRWRSIQDVSRPYTVLWVDAEVGTRTRKHISVGKSTVFEAAGQQRVRWEAYSGVDVAASGLRIRSAVSLPAEGIMSSPRRSTGRLPRRRVLDPSEL